MFLLPICTALHVKNAPKIHIVFMGAPLRCQGVLEEKKAQNCRTNQQNGSCSLLGPVGANLFAKAVCQAMMQCLYWPFRE
jgi:hypothetical protein